MIELVVFDMAGTTVRDQHEVELCFAKAARTTGLDVSDETILAVQGWSKRFVFEKLWADQIGKDHAEYEEKVEHSYMQFRSILEAHYEQSEINPTEGCLELFEFLRNSQIKIALTTGFYRKVVDVILDRLGWLKDLDENYLGNETSLIDLSIASDEVENGRPAPDMIFKAMKILGVQDASHVINIGDTPSDLASGLAAGCVRSLAVTNGTHSKEQLITELGDGLIKSLSDLIPMIKELNEVAV